MTTFTNVSRYDAVEFAIPVLDGLAAQFCDLFKGNSGEVSRVAELCIEIKDSPAKGPKESVIVTFTFEYKEASGSAEQQEITPQT